VNTELTVFWYVTLSNFVSGFQYFGGNFCLYLHSRKQFYFLKKEAASPSDRLLPIYKISRRHSSVYTRNFVYEQFTSARHSEQHVVIYGLLLCLMRPSQMLKLCVSNFRIAETNKVLMIKMETLMSDCEVPSIFLDLLKKPRKIISKIGQNVENRSRNLSNSKQDC
jgi:hypothetical protein